MRTLYIFVIFCGAVTATAPCSDSTISESVAASELLLRENVQLREQLEGYRKRVLELERYVLNHQVVTSEIRAQTKYSAYLEAETVVSRDVKGAMKLVDEFVSHYTTLGIKKFIIPFLSFGVFLYSEETRQRLIELLESKYHCTYEWGKYDKDHRESLEHWKRDPESRRGLLVTLLPPQ